MAPQVFGIEHILYLILSTAFGAAVLILIRKYAKTEKAQSISLKCFAFFLLAAILANRLAKVFSDEQVRWYCIIPDSYCGMTSLVLALAVLFGKKNNCLLHFSWLLALFGGISTVIYPAFISYNSSFFHLATISGLLHHSLSAILSIALLLLGRIDITYKKWHYVILGFTCYLTVGAFLMSVFKVSDAFHIVEPLLSDTNLTTWVMAPMYIVGHGAIFAIIELVRYKKVKNEQPTAKE